VYLNYIEPLFRPPSEARSLILQVTNGCSWNHCTFCEMYTLPQKQFRPKDEGQIEEEIRALGATGVPLRRVFLADGDVMTLSVRRLEQILRLIRQHLPSVERVASYCLPRNVRRKSLEELTHLRELGLTLVYVGCESGDDEVLAMVRKGETFASSLESLNKLQAAGIRRSIMILNGLGGVQWSEQHAVHSAELMNQAQPEFLSTLVVSFPTGMERFQEGYGGAFEPLSQPQLFEEMELLLSTLELNDTVFRSDHASNYLSLKGTMNRDKEALLKIVRSAIHRPGSVPLRQEWQRGL
jgi:radical SAM superfamily enzyme YgiQ (UPF0313 family)